MKHSKIVLIILCIILVIVPLICLIIFITNDKLKNVEVRKITPPSSSVSQHAIFPLDIYETEDCYIITILKEGIGAEFTKDRKCRACFGIIPIKIKETHIYLNKEFSLVERMLGEYHTDIGSGFFTPSYISEDGYLICFQVENNYVTDVQKIDLLKDKKTGDGSLS